jgi:hypothetical protein
MHTNFAAVRIAPFFESVAMDKYKKKWLWFSKNLNQEPRKRKRGRKLFNWAGERVRSPPGALNFDFDDWFLRNEHYFAILWMENGSQL